MLKLTGEERDRLDKAADIYSANKAALLEALHKYAETLDEGDPKLGEIRGILAEVKKGRGRPPTRSAFVMYLVEKYEREDPAERWKHTIRLSANQRAERIKMLKAELRLLEQAEAGAAKAARKGKTPTPVLELDTGMIGDIPVAVVTDHLQEILEAQGLLPKRRKPKKR